MSTLRGGKNVYGPHNLQGNWTEERLEPHHQKASEDKALQLAPATAKQWSKTSEEVGAHSKHLVSATSKVGETWISYQEHPDRFNTTTGTTHCHPDLQEPPFKGPPKPDLTEYHATWTKGDAGRFEKPKTGYAP
mmetsp:Transcript_92810/g.266912  ORF Transcript_92810/g.266912 Transcript_92810/m.266912 type:complete len:134 (-) Transcript_92810:88-489(-)